MSGIVERSRMLTDRWRLTVMDVVRVGRRSLCLMQQSLASSVTGSMDVASVER